MDLIDVVVKKGWTREETTRMVSILEKGELKKTRNARLLGKANVWLALALLLLAHTCVALVIFPVLLVSTSVFVVIFLLFTGLSVGLLSDILLFSVEQTTRRQYTISSIVLPLCAALLLYGVTSVSNGMSAQTHNPFVVALTYSSAFLLPLLYHFYETRMNQRIERWHS